MDPVGWLIFGLCVFIACLSFKPSEPYLTQYLTCDKETEINYCSQYSSESDCAKNTPCAWILSTSTCSITSCDTVPLSLCGDDDYDYCIKSSNNAECNDVKCYKDFTEDEVNNDIYPWSTYAYLPFLLIMGPLAELYSYRLTILCGICGRVGTRFLLLYGNTLLEMQLMQVVYSLGTAAEDVFTAYIFYVVPLNRYQSATSHVKASALIACVLSGVLGDLLVVEAGWSLRVLMWISAVFVCLGFLLGLLVLRAPTHMAIPTLRRSPQRGNQSESDQDGDKVDSSDNNDSMAEVLASNTTPSPKHNTNADGGSQSTPRQSWRQSWAASKSLSSRSSPFDHSNSFYGDSSVKAISNSDSKTQEQHQQQKESRSKGSSDKKHSFSSAECSSTNTEDCNVGNLMDTLKARLFRLRGGSRHSSFSNANIAARGGMGKVEVFAHQMGYLFIALRNKRLLALLMLWTVGNAVYTVLYNYEVSLYEELHGSNDWNGCVLAVMLLLGSVGAMVPTWLQHDQVVVSEGESVAANDPAGGDVAVESRLHSDTLSSSVRPVTEYLLAVRMSVACVVSSITLVLCVGAWKTVPSVSFLALFFGTWQYVNVTVYARLALQLKLAQIKYGRHCNRRDEKRDSDSVFSSVVVSGVGGGAEEGGETVQNKESNGGITRGDRQQQPSLSVRIDDPYDSSSSEVYRSLSYSPLVGNSSRSNEQYDIVDTSNVYQHRTVHCGPHTPHRSLVPEIISVDLSTPADKHADFDPSPLAPLSPVPAGAHGNKTATDSEIPEPPYSIAIVSIIAINVMVQVVMQVVLFSWLQLSLRNACVILVLIFCGATIAYLLYTLCCFRGKRNSQRHEAASSTIYSQLIAEDHD